MTTVRANRIAETYSKLCLTIFTKSSILDVWQGTEYASEHCCNIAKILLTNMAALSYKTYLRPWFVITKSLIM